MINAVMHILAWGLVVILVWGHLDQAPKPKENHFQAMAELGAGAYLVATGDANKYGLIKFDDKQLGYRSIKIDDWEGDLAGRIIGLCAVKRYEGEVVAAVAKDNGHVALVHIQLRNWLKTPKSAILGQVRVPIDGAIEAFSCGDASANEMSVTLYGQGESYTGAMAFKPYELSSLRSSSLDKDLVAAYETDAGRWALVRDLPTKRSVIWFFPLVGEAYPAFTLDGFNVTGIAAGPEGYDISVVTSELGLGSVWRPLGSSASR